MDFWQLLGLAEDKQKEKPSSSEGKFLSTKMAPPQKDPKQKKLSENVRKLMESKASEQVAKEKEAEEKRKKLLQLRSEDKKSLRTMKKMLVMAKSNDKSAADDVKLTVDITNKSREQCDDDDYGYESNAARSFFDKLMTKYEKKPEDPMDMFTKSGNKKKMPSDMAEIKSRVRDRIAEGDADDKPQRSRQSHKGSGSGSHRLTKEDEGKYAGSDKSRMGQDSVRDKPRIANEDHHKKKSVSAHKHPPPPSFADLIRMAEEAKTKPVEVQPKKTAAVKEYEFERPMTSKEKEEYFREKAAQERRAALAAAPAKKSSGKLGNKPGPASSKNKGSPDTSKLREILTNPKGGGSKRDDRSISKEKDNYKNGHRDSRERESSGAKSGYSRDRESPPSNSKNGFKDRDSSSSRNGYSKDSSSGFKDRDSSSSRNGFSKDSSSGFKDRESSSAKNEHSKERDSYSSSNKNGYSKDRGTPPSSSRSYKDPPPSSSSSSKSGYRDKEPSSSNSKNNFKEPKKMDPPPPVKKPPTKIVGPEFHPAVVKSRPVERSQSSSGSKGDRYGSQSSSKGKSIRDVSKEKKRFPDKHSSKRSRSRSPEYRRERLPSRSPSPEFRRKSDSKNSKRLRIDSESEYDSEMDDFIDDTDCKIDISAEIRNIFGYDRNKYRHEKDFDDRSMECNRFSDVMREEARSAKLGRMEDLEDMRREEEEKKRKMKKKSRR